MEVWENEFLFIIEIWFSFVFQMKNGMLIIGYWPCVGRKCRQARQGAKLAKIHIFNGTPSMLKRDCRIQLIQIFLACLASWRAWRF
ncbi:hypothetical protein RCIA160 [Methanocella arvoryzae MRE50]|uniref:Uncharacterized protein n=1 Tax=Methanocella arvoryzae (strain DSM 22066 / NBRC 105507 / MRE50) TaxID=351160 RepID=Q0W2U0_METAR|nr:hypothetical protein RCIA160 [Methanocella arvoryzae MRE50]